MSRKLSLVIIGSLTALTALGTLFSASATQIRQDTYCLQGRQSGYPGNCAFSTYQQCIATASGTSEGCGINPMRAFNRPARDWQGY